jgi:hypothetical protein
MRLGAGGWDREDHSLLLACAISSREPHLQNNQTKMDWRYDSGNRAPALQTQNPEFQCQSH